MARELTPQEIAERSLIKTYRKTLWNPFIAAVKRYELVSPGDHIAVCISGGKDSVVLAKLMQELRKHTDQPFELTFLVMDPGYNPANRALIEENAKLLGIPVTIFDSDIFDVTVQVDKSPCYLCARMRRGCLYAKAKELGCNKIAYAHHRDDFVDTLFLSLLQEGRIASLSPQYVLERTGLTLIRPLMLIPEAQIKGFCNKYALPVVKNSCPADGYTTREKVRQTMRQLQKDYPDMRERVFTAICNADFDDWLKVENQSSKDEKSQ